MPTCASESLTRMWQSNESIHAGSVSSSSSGIHSPCSSTSFSPVSTSPDNTLRRKRIRRASTVGHIPLDTFVIHSDHRDSRSQSPVLQHTSEDSFFAIVSGIIGWYPCLLLCSIRDIILAVLPQTLKQLVFALPMFWITMWIWLVTQLVQLPMKIFTVFLSLVFKPTVELNRKKRTVLISGGSTIQALHLARNFYSAGARVIVCEVNGLFALTKYSTAVSKFYTVPKPSTDQLHTYIKALCEIADKEQVLYYIPVSATTPAYYDAVAKPRLENLGCSCFCPDVEEIWALDDTLEVMKLCQKYKIATPVYHAVTSKEEIYRLYDSGAIRMRNVMSAAGPSGLRERWESIMPLSKSDLRVPADINELRPWVIVQDVEGEHYSTCTTVKESRVVANVTCRMNVNSNGLIPVENKDINQWLRNFFGKLHLLRPITGHISFSFVIPKDESNVIPLSSRVGVSLPYICYTNVHPRLVWRPCKHFTRQNSGPLVNENGRYCLPETLMTTIRNPSLKTVTRLIGTVLDKREVLFAIWDPLPYCAYYHMQVPFKNTLGFLQRRQDSFSLPITTPVR